jgi:hypothetical protein
MSVNESSDDDDLSVSSDSSSSVISIIDVTQKNLESNMEIAWTLGLSHVQAKELFSKIASARADRIAKITDTSAFFKDHDTKSKNTILKRIYLMESRFLSVIASLFSYMVICRKTLASSHLKCIWDEKGNKSVIKGMENQFSQMQTYHPNKFGNICTRLISHFVRENPDQFFFDKNKLEKRKFSLDELRINLSLNLKKKLKLGMFSYETYIQNGKQKGMMIEHKDIFLKLHLHSFLKTQN